jgi:uncharacterized RDD family membrane protein YckC
MQSVSLLRTFHVATTWKRAGAFAIDGGLFCLPYVLSGALGDSLRGGGTFYSWNLLTATFALGLFHQIFFLKRYGRTLGKMAFSLRVVAHPSLAPALTWSEAIRRGTFTVFGGVALLGIPQAFALFQGERRQLADLFAETIVVQDQPRAQEPRARWLIGAAAMIYFAVVATGNIVLCVNSLSVTEDGLLLQKESVMAEPLPQTQAQTPAPQPAQR